MVKESKSYGVKVFVLLVAVEFFFLGVQGQAPTHCDTKTSVHLQNMRPRRLSLRLSYQVSLTCLNLVLSIFKVDN